MFVIGLTGGIGSGKSAVTALFAKHGIPIIDADVIARDVTSPNSSAYLDIIDHFEETILLEDGSLNRAKLREIVFTQPEQRIWLEKLLHPLILEEIIGKIARVEAPYCIIVIPLLNDVKDFPFLDRVLVIDAPIPDQIERVSKRDNIRPLLVETMLKTQIPREKRVLFADDIITNDKTTDDLIHQVDRLHRLYLEMAAML